MIKTVERNKLILFVLYFIMGMAKTGFNSSLFDPWLIFREF